MFPLPALLPDPGDLSLLPWPCVFWIWSTEPKEDYNHKLTTTQISNCFFYTYLSFHFFHSMVVIHFSMLIKVTYLHFEHHKKTLVYILKSITNHHLRLILCVPSCRDIFSYCYFPSRAELHLPSSVMGPEQLMALVLLLLCSNPFLFILFGDPVVYLFIRVLHIIVINKCEPWTSWCSSWF